MKRYFSAKTEIERVESEVIRKIEKNQRPTSVVKKNYLSITKGIRNAASDYPTFKFVTLDELLDK